MRKRRGKKKAIRKRSLLLRAKSNGLRAAFRRGKRRGPALVAYVTAGDPSLKFTEKLVLRMAEAGADVVELGVPFSDPIADGPVIQRASERALKAGTTLPGVLKLAERLRRKSAVPLVLFSYYNTVLQMGVERFAARAAAAGVSGVLITDLTPEEAGEFVRTLRRHKLDTVFLAAPTSSNGRLRSIARLSRGFVYLIARRGVTGAPTEVGSEIRALVKRLRRSTRLPVAVGFGISRPQQVASLDGLVDGVVVGSALVQCCEEAGHGPAALEDAVRLVQELKNKGREGKR